MVKPRSPIGALSCLVFLLAAGRLGLTLVQLPPDSWVPLGPSGASVLALAADPGDSRRLCAGTETEVVCSADDGQSWQPLGQEPPSSVRGLVLLAGPPGLVLAATGEGIRRRARDSAWEPVDGEPGRRAALGLETAEGALYAILERGVYRSRDGGLTWESLTAPLGDIAILGHHVGTGDPRRHWLATEHGVFTSLDDGRSWQRLEGGLQGLRVLGFASHPTDPLRVYAVAGTPNGGIFLSTDGGASWERAKVPAEFAVVVNVDARQSGLLYAALAGTADGVVEAGVVRSEDGGASWRQVKTGLMNTTVFALLRDPLDPNVLYAGTNGGGVFRYANPPAWAEVHRAAISALETATPLVVGLLLVAIVVAAGRRTAAQRR